MTSLVLGTLALLASLIAPPRADAASPAVVTPAQASDDVVVTGLQVHDSAVSGNVVNASTKSIREVKLLIRQAWLWNDERHPGADNPGRALTFVLHPDINPRGSASFTFQTPPMPARSDGRFVTTAEIVAFTEVGW